jgi:hypothetical protein
VAVAVLDLEKSGVGLSVPLEEVVRVFEVKFDNDNDA